MGTLEFMLTLQPGRTGARCQSCGWTGDARAEDEATVAFPRARLFNHALEEHGMKASKAEVTAKIICPHGAIVTVSK